MVRYPLSEYRIELMGLGAIGILIAHSHAFLGLSNKGVLLTGYLGFMGVYLFSFLSGIGLVFAMQKGIKRFYIRRLSKVILPYLVISMFFYGIKYLPQGNVGRFFYMVSTLAYWVEHEGAWYVAMLIPLYCVYPVLWYINERFNYILNDVIICLILVLLSGILDFSSVYNHYFCKVFNCYIVFLLGDIYTRKVNKDGYKIGLDFLYASLLILVFFVCKLTDLKYYHFIVSIGRGFLGIGFSLLFAIAVAKVLRIPAWCSLVLKFSGKYSLELYLLNIFLIMVAKDMEFQFVWQIYALLISLEYLLLIIWDHLKTAVLDKNWFKIT